MLSVPNRQLCAFFAGLCTILAGNDAAEAQTTPGVTEKELVIGSCSALEGPSSFLGRETVAGAEAYFRYVNDEGGINGRKLRLVSADDSYDPAKTEACSEKLTAQKVFALGFFVGTPTAVKYVPLAESHQIPLVGLFTGAQTLYTPLRRWVISVRASYFDETREQVDGLWKTLHYRKIAVIYPEDAFGGAVLEGVETALKTNGAEPVATASYVRQSVPLALALCPLSLGLPPSPWHPRTLPDSQNSASNLACTSTSIAAPN
jgi:branched-chain amino acid transport system substrate-binding protein